MKKVFFRIILISVLSLTSVVHSIIFVPTSVFAVDSTGSAVDKKAQDLLDRVATKVASLASKLRRVYTGQVKSVGTNSLVLTTVDGDRTLTTGDVTSFFRIRSGNKTEINFSSLKVTDDLAAIGTVDPSTSEMTAKQIIAKVRRYNVVGKVVAVNKSVYSIAEINGPVTKVDLSDTGTLETVSPNNQITPTKRSSIKIGDTVFVMAYIFDPKSDVFSVLKAIQLPQ